MATAGRRVPADLPPVVGRRRPTACGDPAGGGSCSYTPGPDDPHRDHRRGGARGHLPDRRVQRPDPSPQPDRERLVADRRQLKRRLDLIPNLVETVKGYAAHERETLDAVIQARNSAIAAPDTPHAQAEADNQLTGALRQVFALGEAYPDLKANQNFLALQEELTATEVGSPTPGSSTTTACSTTTTSSSSSRRFFARRLKFEKREYFEADEAARVPTVEF